MAPIFGSTGSPAETAATRTSTQNVKTANFHFLELEVDESSRMELLEPQVGGEVEQPMLNSTLASRPRAPACARCLHSQLPGIQGGDRGKNKRRTGERDQTAGPQEGAKERRKG